MMLADVRDYIAALGLAEHVYMGKLPGKKKQSIGVYHSKHERAYKTAIGGPALESYGIKYVTFLIHWNASPRDTEKAALGLFRALQETQEVTINEEKIKFIQPLVQEPMDAGTDDTGVYEMVIEAAVFYAKKGE